MATKWNEHVVTLHGHNLKHGPVMHLKFTQNISNAIKVLKFGECSFKHNENIQTILYYSKIFKNILHCIIGSLFYQIAFATLFNSLICEIL